MLDLEGMVALHSFGGALLAIVLTFMCSFFLEFNLCTTITAIAVNVFTLYTALCYVYKNDLYFFRIAIRAGLLGVVFTLGTYIRLTAPSNYQIFGSYMSVLAFFHYSEFLAIAYVQPRQVSVDSFVINHSLQYTIAAVTSWVEFFIEAYFFPELKQFKWISDFGLCVCICGEILRKTAILTAGSNFNHLVQCERVNDHVLVTHGVYGWWRHPSYVGWFYWSIGTQLILVNPICLPAYATASWLFFKERVYIEEIQLLNFFGQQYCDYQLQVSTGIPFIEGYKI